ncbi:unnamed protein product [Leptosia nina]|uniref:Uncharacterized protein n=1 Tax=Leptosia nina TaxID=320188 RepID=A0AAV1J3M5_9NEOP
MSGHAHTRPPRPIDTTTLAISSGARTRAHSQASLVNHTLYASVLARVGVRTRCVLLARPDEMMPNCKREREVYRFYKMAGYD